jgi:hypothetical protein
VIATAALQGYVAVYRRADGTEQRVLPVVGYITNDVGGQPLVMHGLGGMGPGWITLAHQLEEDWNNHERAVAEKEKGTTERGYTRVTLNVEESNALQARRWCLDEIRNQQQPAGVLSFPDRLTTDELERIREQLDSADVGVLVAEHGATYTPFNYGPALPTQLGEIQTNRDMVVGVAAVVALLLLAAWVAWLLLA